MAIEKRTLSGNNPKLTIDLVEMFGQRVPDSEAFRQGVGQAIIDKIRERTAEKIDRSGKRFRNYSKRYAESEDFKIHGKSKTDPNLKLTGDMLAFIDVISTSRNTITLGWDDNDEAAKAHGHITGAPQGPKVKRDFFGLPDKEYKSLTSEFSVPSEEPTSTEVGLLSTLVTLRELFSDG